MRVSRNESCPCGSGRKYKKCCLEKERSSRLNFTVEDIIQRLNEKGSVAIGSVQEPSNSLKKILFEIDHQTIRIPCVSPIDQPCAGKIIDSHTISKEKGLRFICDNSNHVMMFSRDLDYRKELAIEMERVGINEACLFHALCDQHDSAIFKDIDDSPLIPTPKQIFLFSYRSHIFEFYAKTVLLKKLDATIKALGQNEEARSRYEYYNWVRPGWNRDYQHVKLFKEIHDKSYIRQDYESDFKTVWRRVPKLPFAVGAYFTPKYDLIGNAVPRSPDPLIPWPELSLNVVPEADSSLIIFTMPRYFEKPLSSFFADLEKLNSYEEFSQAVWEITLRNIENAAYNPAFWEALKPHQQDHIEEFFSKTRSGYDGFWVPFPEDIFLKACLKNLS